MTYRKSNIMSMRQLLVLLFVLMLSGQILAFPNISISKSKPIANETFRITVSDDTFPNGCVPTEIFRIQLVTGNRIQITAMPTSEGQICTQAIRSYSVNRNAIIATPGDYTREYYIGFNTSRLTTKQITVLPDPSDTNNEEDEYTRGWKDSALNCLFAPEACGIGDSSASFHGTELDIPVLTIPGPFGVTVNKFAVVLEFIPLSDPVMFKLKSVKLLDDEAEEK